MPNPIEELKKRNRFYVKKLEPKASFEAGTQGIKAKVELGAEIARKPKQHRAKRRQ